MREQMLIEGEYSRIQERLKDVYFSQDKEHFGVEGLLIGASMAKLLPL